MLYSLGNRQVVKDAEAWVSETATIIGSVILDRDSSIWFNAVLRGDNDVIHIGQGTNIQDGCILHTDENLPLKVERNVTVGHQVMLHGCHIREESLIGMKSIILDKAEIGKNCLVGANTLITQGKKIPDRSLVLGSPGRVVRQLTEREIEKIRMSAKHYITNSKNFQTKLKAQC